MAVWVLAISSGAIASEAGINGVSGNPNLNNGIVCSNCHVNGGTATVQLLSGNGGALPASINGGTPVNLLVRVAGAGTRAGFNISTSSPFASFRAVNMQEVTPPTGTDLTHFGPKTLNGGQATFGITLETAHVGGTVTIYGAGLAANGAGTGGDNFGRFTTNITVNPSPGAPLVQTAAKATPAANSTYDVEVLGIDNSPEAQLTYTWSATGPGPVTFTPNGTNAAKKASAAVNTPGSYVFTATIRDPDGSTKTSTVEVNVGAYAARIMITPESVTLPTGGTVQFTAQAMDQFNKPLSPQPIFSWSVVGSGSINKDTGFYKAGNFPGGPFTVAVSGGGPVSSASVTIVSASGTAPTLAKAPTASPNGMGAQLSVMGADDGGEAALSYTWSVISGPSGATFTTNGSNAAKTTRVNVTQTGNYRLGVTVKDASNLTTSASVDVNITGQAGATDSQPPVVSVSVSGNAKTVSGNVTVVAEAADNVGVTEVVFQLDGSTIGSASAAPWQLALDSRKYTNGKHTLVAIARDAAGNEGRSTGVELEINNGGGGGGGAGGCSSAPTGGALALLALVLFFWRARPAPAPMTERSRHDL